MWRFGLGWSPMTLQHSTGSIWRQWDGNSITLTRCSNLTFCHVYARTRTNLFLRGFPSPCSAGLTADHLYQNNVDVCLVLACIFAKYESYRIYLRPNGQSVSLRVIGLITRQQLIRLYMRNGAKFNSSKLNMLCVAYGVHAVLNFERGGSNEHPQSMFWAEIWKIYQFLSENFHFLVVKCSVYLNRLVFVMMKCYASNTVLETLIKFRFHWLSKQSKLYQK